MPQAKHCASLVSTQPDFKNETGTVLRMEAAGMPLLNRLSLRRLMLKPRGLREPHWHANAHELGYCLRGEHLVTIVASHNERHNFTIGKGEMFFVPSGALHSIQNTGDAEGEILLGFSSETVEDFGLSGVFGHFTPAVIGNSVGVPESEFSQISFSRENVVIAAAEGAPEFSQQAQHASPYKYSLEATRAQVASSAGSAHVAEIPLWPVLDAISMFSVRITQQGMREIHWHPETAEMGYVTAGSGRMSVVDPDGTTDTYTMAAGDMYFIPRAYPHHIENIGQDTLHILIFFDRNTPADIGALPVVSGFSPDVLAATFRARAENLPRFPITEIDPLIVPRLNPVDR